jgi:hypothetical protein
MNAKRIRRDRIPNDFCHDGRILQAMRELGGVPNSGLSRKTGPRFPADRINLCEKGVVQGFERALTISALRRDRRRPPEFVNRKVSIDDCQISWIAMPQSAQFSSDPSAKRTLKIRELNDGNQSITWTNAQANRSELSPIVYRDGDWPRCLRLRAQILPEPQDGYGHRTQNCNGRRDV